MQYTVCGADIHKEDEPEQAEHKGETYYFDSVECQEQFKDSFGEYA